MNAKMRGLRFWKDWGLVSRLMLAVGTAIETPVVKDGQVTIAPIMHATISADHRVADGAVAAQFMQALKTMLESPMRLLI